LLLASYLHTGRVAERLTEAYPYEASFPDALDRPLDLDCRFLSAFILLPCARFFVSVRTDVGRATMTTAPKKAKTRTSQPRHSDAYLVAECLKGKEFAWSALVDRYKNLIFSIPIRYGFSEEDSADVFQAVCMDLLAELRRLRDPEALAGWLIQVTRNKCLHRKQSGRRHNVQEIGDLDPPDPAGEPENLVSQIQQAGILREALAELPRQCRELVKMLFFETPPRPYEEVAKELHLARGSIGFLRRSCLDKLKERLESRGY
jgi:RNA polymerase sigma factor (sigma-70 family)